VKNLTLKMGNQWFFGPLRDRPLYSPHLQRIKIVSAIRGLEPAVAMLLQQNDAARKFLRSFSSPFSSAQKQGEIGL